jgi:hypothetical protein
MLLFIMIFILIKIYFVKIKIANSIYFFREARAPKFSWGPEVVGGGGEVIGWASLSCACLDTYGE